MGLNIGVRVKRQEEGYMSEGYNPKTDGLRERFDSLLREKFPSDAFAPVAGLEQNGRNYVFDVRLDYAWNNYDSTPMYLAILEFVLSNFSAGYGIDLHIYHSP